jgi:hypothetical protein
MCFKTDKQGETQPSTKTKKQKREYSTIIISNNNKNNVSA